MNLASAMSGGEVKDLDSVKEYAGDRIKRHLDVTDTDGYTPLMIACRNGQLATAEWLLENGANVNFSSARDGNTALHLTCRGDDKIVRQCRKWKDYPLQSMDVRVNILNLLFKNGATTEQNRDGLLPLHVAALHSQTVIVKFLMEEKFELPVEEKIRALEILAFSQSVCDTSHISGAYETLCKVRSMRQDLTPGTSETLTDSDFESVLNQYEYPLKDLTFSDIESERDDHTVKIQGFIIGYRVLPSGLKEKYLFEPLADFASNSFFKGNQAEGFRIFKFLLSLESQCRLKLGTVVRQLASNIYTSNASSIEYVLRSCELVASYRDVVHNVDESCVLKNGAELFEYLRDFSFNLAFNHGGAELCDSLVKSVGGVVSLVQDIFKLSAADCTVTVDAISVTHGIMYSLGEAFDDNIYCGMSKKSVSYVKYVLLRLLPYDNVCYADKGNNTMLHYLMHMIWSASDMDFTVDMARALVRHGCPLHAINSEGCTAVDILLENSVPGDTGRQELMILLDSSKNVLTLEELAMRAVLQNKIPYRDVLPSKICEMLEGVNDFHVRASDSSSESGSESS